MRARYVATRDEIGNDNTEWEIIGPPEIRDLGLPPGASRRFASPRKPERADVRTAGRCIRISNGRPTLTRWSASWRHSPTADTSCTACDGDGTQMQGAARDYAARSARLTGELCGNNTGASLPEAPLPGFARRNVSLASSTNRQLLPIAKRNSSLALAARNRAIAVALASMHV